MRLWPQTRLWRILFGLALAFLVYSAGTYLGVPPLIRYVARNQGRILHRQITTGVVTFNPYKLRLIVDDVQMDGRDAAQPFIAIAQVNLRLSWSSLWRRALVVKQLAVERPSIHAVRLGPTTFDFSDLIPPVGRQNSGSKPWRFAISNIEVNGGVIILEDSVVKEQHRIEDIRVAIPFIANLPTDVDEYVQPLLQMTVDGSPLHLAGRAKPFGAGRESMVDLKIDNLDLVPVSNYAGNKLPIKLIQGALSAALQIHFVQVTDRPRVELAGTIGLQNVAVRDAANSPLAEVKQLQMVIAEAEPLDFKLHLSSVKVDAPATHLVLNQDGTTNLAASFKPGRASSPQPIPPSAGSLNTGAGNGVPMSGAATPQPGAGQTPSTPSPPLSGANPRMTAPSNSPATDQALPSGNQQIAGSANQATEGPNAISLSVDSLQLNDGTVEVLDRAGPTPVTAKLEAIQLGLSNFDNVGTKPAAYDMSGKLGAGRISAKGNLNLSSTQLSGNVELADIDIAPLQALLRPSLVATIGSGKLSAQATIRGNFGHDRFNIHLEPATVALDSFEVRSAGVAPSVLGFKRLTAKIEQFDQASHQVGLGEVSADGLQLTAKRDRQNNPNPASMAYWFAPGKPSSADQRGNPGTSAEWQYRIKSIVLQNANTRIEDDSAEQPLLLQVAPLNLHLVGFSNDLSHTVGIESDGHLINSGTFKVTGEMTPRPFGAKLHVSTQRIDLASFEPFLAGMLQGKRLNAKVTKAQLTSDGDAEASVRQGRIQANYRGGGRIGNVRVLDTVTGDNLLRWYALDFDHAEVRIGAAKPLIRIGGTTLNDFYARIILNADGRLNLRDLVTSGEQPPVALTKPGNVPSSEAAASPADIAIGGLTLDGGEVTYIDNFIRPNYSADLTKVSGKVGAFGTSSRQPADVLMTAEVNGNSPVSIRGSINPLTPMAYLDVNATASRIELSPLTPYSTKYTGYPITGGTLAGDVHYLLQNRQLTARNHIILDQLTFGERTKNSSARNLPVRLAVAVLKDSQGRIDLSLPVSGSLRDPRFDLGEVIWQALENVIIKAAASPFTLLASAVGGGKQNLAYVEFAPGYSNLSEAAKSKLATLATVLNQRRSLKLAITGRVDPAVDTEGLREAMLDQAIKQRKAQDEHERGPVEQVQVTPDEYNRYLRRVYKAADFPKPRAVLGIAKSIPPAEMKKLLLANIKVGDQDLRRLADARAQAVYQVLAAKVDSVRLSIASAKLDASGAGNNAPTTRADFSLR